MNWVSIGSDNGLLPIRRQAIIWTNAGLLSIGPLGTNFSEILIKIQNFSFTKIHLKISSAKWRPFCPGGDQINKENTIKRSALHALYCTQTMMYKNLSCMLHQQFTLIITKIFLLITCIVTIVLINYMYKEIWQAQIMRYHDTKMFCHITGHLWGVSIGHWWISFTKGQQCGALVFS